MVIDTINLFQSQYVKPRSHKEEALQYLQKNQTTEEMVGIFVSSTIAPQNMPLLAYVTISICVVFYYLVTLIAPTILRASFLGKFYSKLDYIDQKEWNNRLASNSNAFIMLSVGIYFICLGNFMELEKAPYRTDFETDLWYLLPFTGIFQGYLIYDYAFIIYNRNTKIWDFGMLIHHSVGTFIGLTLSFYRAGFYYYSTLVWVECSTPLVNNQWFLLKAGMQESPLFILNAIVTYVIFFLCRVLYLPSTLYHWYYHFWLVQEQHQVPWFPVLLIGIFLSTISIINIYWFYLMSYKFYERLWLKVKKH